MDWVLGDVGALVAAVIIAVPLCLVAWATGVLIRENMRGAGSVVVMPGWEKGGILIVTTVTSVAALIGINVIWGEEVGRGLVIVCWVILCLGLAVSLYVIPAWQFEERGTWKLRQVMALTGIIMVIGLPLSFINVYDGLKPEDGKIVSPQDGNGMVPMLPPRGPSTGVDSTCGPPLRGNKVTMELKPWHEEATVGTILPFGVTVFNCSGKTIAGLKVELPPGEGYAVEDGPEASLASLTPNSHWGEVFLNAKMLRSGEQTVEFTLRYGEEDTGEKKVITSLWKGPVSGPVLEVKRSIFFDRDLIEGQVVHVWLLTKNVGLAPAIGLTVEPNLGAFFEAVGGLDSPGTLGPDEEFFATYQAQVIAPGGLALNELKPRVTFSDAAGNVHGGESVEVKNFLCPVSDECSPRDKITIATLEPGDTPLVSIGPRPDLFVDQSDLQVQIRPGDAQSKDLSVYHNSDRPQLVQVQPTEENSRFLKGFDRTVQVPPGDKVAVPGSVSVPLEIELGVYHPTLEVQLFTQDGRPIGVPRKVPFRVEVTQVHIKHSVPSRVVALAQSITVTTTIINFSDQAARIRFSEDFPGGGMTVTATIDGPVGQGGGSEGDFYFKEFTLQPGASKKRTFQFEATDNVPPKKLLEGRVDYTLENGVGGSASDTVRFLVEAPEGEGRAP